ncbi:MAG: gluconolactonase [Actinomycetota bacterium]|nr:gluconolactonase [Actinomycetota bacterium]
MTLWLRGRRAVGAAVTAFALCVGPVATASGHSSAVVTPRPTLRSLVAPGAKIVMVAEGLAFAEGPVWIAGKGLIVSDVLADNVVVFDAAGKKRILRQPSDHANGHALDMSGAVVEADGGDAGNHRGVIARLAGNGSATVLASAFHGKRFNSPNDLIVKRDGTIWFTDPDFGKNSAVAGIGFNGVYRLDPRTKAMTAVINALPAPNGIAFSPDEKTLYVSDSVTNQVLAFPLARDGSVGPKRVLGIGCDGIGVDEHGDVWASTCGGNIEITSPRGKRIGAIAFPGTTTSLAWGGAGGKTLFVTTQEGGVYRLALTVRGTR